MRFLACCFISPNHIRSIGSASDPLRSLDYREALHYKEFLSAPRQQISARTLGILSILAAVALQWLICEQADTRVSLDTDVVNLALSIERFNIQEHQPHPPGYLGYVLVLRAAHTISGPDPVVTTKLVARFMISLSLLLVFLAVRELDPDRPASARWALALGATSPMLLYYGVDGQTHAAEAAAAAALLWLLARSRRPSAGLPTAVAIGILLAIGGAFRPSIAVLVVVAVPWCYWGRWRELTVITIAGALGTAAWLCQRCN